MNLSALERNKSRVFYFDFLRFSACLMIVLLHVSAGYLSSPVLSADFMLANLADSLSRAGVPFFVMISGALMLDEAYSFTKEKQLRHIGKQAGFFLFWSFGYCVVFRILYPMLLHGEVDISNAVFYFLKGHYHLWFLPMIIGLYLITPLLRLWVKRENKRYVEYFLLLGVVFSILLPQAKRLIEQFCPEYGFAFVLTDQMNLQYSVGYVFYYVLGWYLHNFDFPVRKHLPLLGAAGAAVTFWGVVCVYRFCENPDNIFHSSFTLNVLIYSLWLFTAAKARCGKRAVRKSAFTRTVLLISKYSPGIYALHPAVLSVLFMAIPSPPAVLSLLLVFPMTVVLSAAGVFLLSKIPFFRKLI